MNDTAQVCPFQKTTYIDCQNYKTADGKSDLTIALSSLHAKRADKSGFSELPFLRPEPCTYSTDQPPCAVLEELEKVGFNLVATNTVNETCIWTLHKPV